MKKINTWYAFLSIVFFLIACNGQVAELIKIGENIPVFVQGEGGYACFRIPAIVTIINGDLIAFAEGRRGGCADTGDIDLVMKRSMDSGVSWSSLQLIWDDSTHTCGNPAPVLDHVTGDLFLLATWNNGADREAEIIDQTSIDTRRVFILQSSDGGHVWSKPKDITSDVKLPSWTWYATGPGSGMQKKKTPYKRRLIVGCDHIEAETNKYYSHIIYSDDHGATWQMGGTTPKDQVNECEVAEIPGGILVLNMRNYDREKKYRQLAVSRDGGHTWEKQQHDTTLIEPRCQASLQSFEYEDKTALLFSNPASKDERINMTLRASEDWGRRWPISIVLHAGPAAYSDITILNDGMIGCLFESGRDSPYEEIVFGRVGYRVE